MLIEVKVPALSESVAEATLINWHKQPGEYVERGENLIDIETDKVVLELLLRSPESWLKLSGTMALPSPVEKSLPVSIPLPKRQNCCTAACSD